MFNLYVVECINIAFDSAFKYSIWSVSVPYLVERAVVRKDHPSCLIPRKKITTALTP